MNRLRRLVGALLDAEDAHASVEDAFADIPARKRGTRAPGCPHTPWQLLEHMRLAQRDILDYVRKAKHRSPAFPRGYWPRTAAPPGARAWSRSVLAFLDDLRALHDLVDDPKNDLLAPIPHAPDVSLLEEVFLVANHNSYHAGQLVQLRRALGIWPG